MMENKYPKLLLLGIQFGNHLSVPKITICEKVNLKILKVSIES